MVPLANKSVSNSWWYPRRTNLFVEKLKRGIDESRRYKVTGLSLQKTDRIKISKYVLIARHCVCVDYPKNFANKQVLVMSQPLTSTKRIFCNYYLATHVCVSHTVR